MNKDIAYTQHYTEGDKYQEYKNLTTRDIAKLVRKDIRNKYPSKQGWKISVRSDYFANGSSIDINLKDAPIQIYNKEYAALASAERWDEIRAKQYPNVHPSDEIKQLTNEATELLRDLKKIANRYNYSDCDGMIDYFNVNYWVNVSIYWEAKELLMDKSIEEF